MAIFSVWVGDACTRSAEAGDLFASKEDCNEASTSRESRNDAVAQIPFDKMHAQTAQAIAMAIRESKVFRRLPTTVVQCDPDLFMFLLRHPDVVVGIWEELDITDMTLEQTGPETFQLIDGVGTTATLRFVYRSAHLNILLVEGRHDGTLFARKVTGRGVLVLRSGYARESDGRVYITNRLDAFMSLEPSSIEFLTKTFQPVLGKVADHNFEQTAGFLGSLSRTAEVHRSGVRRLAGRLRRVDPETRADFADMADHVADRAARATASRFPRETEAVGQRSGSSSEAASRVE